MKVAINAPVKPPLCHLELLYDFHLIISRYLNSVPEYENLVKTLINRGDHVILDGWDDAQKTFDSSEEIVANAIRLGVTEIIIPDVFMNAKKTAKSVDIFLSRFKTELKKYNINTIGVIQGKTPAELASMYFWLYDKVDVIGVPDEVGFLYPGGRVEFIQNIIKEFHIQNPNNFHLTYQKPFHMLGIYKNPIEIAQLTYISEVRSLDTTSPIWCALCGKHFSFKNGLENKPAKKTADDYFLSESEINLRVLNNLGCVMKWSINLYEAY